MIILVIERTTMDCTTKMVQDKFNYLFDNQATMIVEESIADESGIYKRFSITLDNNVGYLIQFIDEIHEHGEATIYDDNIMWSISIEK
jgi:hypothetical protein